MDIQNRVLATKYETEIKLVGDMSTIREIVILLSYIRNILDEGRSQDIVVSVGKNIKAEAFGMAVNNMEIPDIKSKDTATIN